MFSSNTSSSSCKSKEEVPLLDQLHSIRSREHLVINHVKFSLNLPSWSQFVTKNKLKLVRIQQTLYWQTSTARPSLTSPGLTCSTTRPKTHQARQLSTWIRCSWRSLTDLVTLTKLFIELSKGRARRAASLIWTTSRGISNWVRTGRDLARAVGQLRDPERGLSRISRLMPSRVTSRTLC